MQRFTIIGAALALLLAQRAYAQPADHLQCYKIKDPSRFRGVVNLDSPQFGLSAQCKVRIHGMKFCAPTRKVVTELDPDVPAVAFDSEKLKFDRICYRVKCSDAVLPAPQVTDQFGTRVVEARSLVEVCTPAFLGPATPPLCGNAIVEPGEECETAVDCGGGAGCSSSCTCECAAADPQCPNVMELTALAGTGSEATSTEEDWGFTGLAHDTDVLDRSRVDLNIACSGSGPSSCDECDIRGVNPDAGNCRCANNNRSLCDQPFQVDGDDCSGAVCECYVAPPTPRSNGNTPFCFLDRLANQPDGTWNVDTGVGTVDLQRRRVVYLGETLVEPCPTCAGDVTANDGLREGTCVGGPSDGMSCDANASDATFPAPGGGQYSYDCLPTAGKNVSGSGVKIDTVSLSTASGSLTAGVDCGFTVSPLICHCGLCSGDPSEPCVSDGECAALGAGTCTDIPGSPAVFPNQCDDGVCSDAGGGEGACTAGPTDKLCDGILRANGEGIINCLSNADCAPGTIGVDAGNCTLSKQRECFLTTIATQGTPDTVQPVASGVACAAKTSNFGVNAVVGLPGASRLRLEAETVFRCSGNPSFAYPSCP